MDERSTLTFLLFLSTACADLKLSVVSPKTATLGSASLLECTFAVGSSPVDPQYLAIIWSFKGNELLRFNNNMKVLEPRASMEEAEIRNGNASLLLTNLAVEDQGMYTCAAIYSPETQEKDIMLNVQAPPRIIIPEKAVIKGKENLLKCSVVGFYPMTIEVSWLQDGKILPGSSTSKPQRYVNGTFMINCTLPLTPTDSDASSKFSCRVHHESLRGYLQEDTQLLIKEDVKGRSMAGVIVSLLLVMAIVAVLGWILYGRPDFPGSLVLGDITGARLVNGDKVSLQCGVSGYFPAKLQVQWLKVEREGGPAVLLANGESDYEMRRTEEVLEDGKGYSCTASLTFTPQLYREQELAFICRVSHPSLERPLERSTGTLPVLAVPKPAEIKMVEPEKNATKNTWLALEVTGFHPPDITIVWHCELPGSKTWGLSSTKSIAKHSDGSYSSLSLCWLSLEEVKKIQAGDVTATIQHESLRHPLKKTIRLGKKDNILVTDFPGFPVLDDITIPQLVHGVEDSLQCKVSGYLPDDLSVEWLKVTRGSDVAARLPDGENGYRISQTEPSRETGWSCSFTSSLTFTPSISRDQDSKFICKVSHPILDKALEKQTGKVTVLAVPTLEKIEVNQSEKKKNPIFTLFLSRFYPKEIEIHWSCHPSSAAHRKQPEEVTGASSSEGTYTATSSFKLSKDKTKKLGTVSIAALVNHPSLREASQVSLQLVTKGDGWKLVSRTPGWDSTGAALIHTQ